VELLELQKMHDDENAYLMILKKLAGIKKHEIPMAHIKSKIRLDARSSPQITKRETQQINLFAFNEESIMELEDTDKSCDWANTNSSGERMQTASTIDEDDKRLLDFLKEAGERVGRRLTACYREAKDI
jgi:hypothetical protein